ncbi:hypothetical protein GGX14DRAFT_556919 [Mycena pura]|uniref:Uncharacterized protein n=1 Tax=Mycena pura TaxID=153505 RepID=A0AAD6YMG1_9AGAR|nr:hypothetical protein GGX14DRAFT_556919 [Mycena pura]
MSSGSQLHPPRSLCSWAARSTCPARYVQCSQIHLPHSGQSNPPVTSSSGQMYPLVLWQSSSPACPLAVNYTRHARYVHGQLDPPALLATSSAARSTCLTQGSRIRLLRATVTICLGGHILLRPQYVFCYRIRKVPWPGYLTLVPGWGIFTMLLRFDEFLIAAVRYSSGGRI